LVIYGLTSRSRIFHLYGDVTIAGEGLQNLGLCSALRAFAPGRSEDINVRYVSKRHNVSLFIHNFSAEFSSSSLARGDILLDELIIYSFTSH
jgi:hypothetical protein